MITLLEEEIHYITLKITSEFINCRIINTKRRRVNQRSENIQTIKMDRTTNLLCIILLSSEQLKANQSKKKRSSTAKCIHTQKCLTGAQTRQNRVSFVINKRMKPITHQTMSDAAGLGQTVGHQAANRNHKMDEQRHLQTGLGNKDAKGHFKRFLDSSIDE